MQEGRRAGLNREILRLAVPNIVSNISVPLLGMVDTALMGRLESEVFIGAVALGSILFSFIYWGFGFLRMGTTGLTAQAFGRRDGEESAAILGRALLVALACGGLLVLLQAGIAWIGFGLIRGDEAVEVLGQQYFSIRIYAAPAALGLFAFHGWFLGMQNARYPMVLTVFTNVLNMAFSVLFVFGMGMKSDGVALGTVCAQYVGLLLAVGMFRRKYSRYAALFRMKQALMVAELKRFFQVNTDIFIRTICLVSAFAVFTSVSAALDSLILAANQILLQYLSLMSYAVDGFAFAAESLVGRYIGERDSLRLRKSVALLFAWGCGSGALFCIGYGFLGKPLLRVFTDQAAIIQTAVPYLWWVAALPLAGSAAYMWDGVYIGATATSAMRNMMLVSFLAVFLPAAYAGVNLLGNHGLWAAMTMFMLSRGLTLGLLARRWVFSRHTSPIRSPDF